jgi:cysteine sulfinate desulfinase/cysteine desulfurase-like protein
VRRLDPDGEGVVLKALTGDFLHLMDKAGLECRVFTPPNSVPGVLCFRVGGITDMEDFFSYLYARDICISRFSACTARVNGVSRILHNMGFAHQEVRASLRMSLGRYSRRKDLIEFITAAGDYLRRR